VSDAEITASVQEMAAAGRVDPKAFESRLRQSGRIQGVKWQLLRDKAADFVVANAIATKPLVEPAEESAEAPATKTTRKKTAVKASAAVAEETAEKTAEKPAPKPRTAAKKTVKVETPAEEEA
jgi:Bacterial trigger factor protein (TF) C-terminus